MLNILIRTVIMTAESKRQMRGSNAASILWATMNYCKSSMKPLTCTAVPYSLIVLGRPSANAEDRIISDLSTGWSLVDKMNINAHAPGGSGVVSMRRWKPMKVCKSFTCQSVSRISSYSCREQSLLFFILPPLRQNYHPRLKKLTGHIFMSAWSHAYPLGSTCNACIDH